MLNLIQRESLQAEAKGARSKSRPDSLRIVCKRLFQYIYMFDHRELYIFNARACPAADCSRTHDNSKVLVIPIL